MNFRHKFITLNFCVFALVAAFAGYYNFHVIHNTVEQLMRLQDDSFYSKLRLLGSHSSNFKLDNSLATFQLSRSADPETETMVLTVGRADSPATVDTVASVPVSGPQGRSLTSGLSSQRTLGVFFSKDYFNTENILLLSAIHLVIIGGMVTVIVLLNRARKKQLRSLTRTIHSILNGSNDRFATESRQFRELSDSLNILMDTLFDQTHHLEKNLRRLDLLTRGIPCGILCCHIDEYYTLSYVNEGFCNLAGHSKQEVLAQYQNTLVHTIYVRDRERVLRQMADQLNGRDMVSTKYRMEGRDGNLLWVMNKGKLIHIGAEPYLYCILIDVTSEQTSREKLLESEERYRIIVGQTNDIVYEWNFETNVVSYSEHFLSLLEYLPTVINQPNIHIIYDHIYPDDLMSFQGWAKKAYYGTEKTQIEIRIKNNRQEYIWIRLTGTPLQNEYGSPVKLIGIIRDITRKKAETEHLHFMAQTDTLTKLYNRGAFEEQAQSEIEKADNLNTKLGFMFVDIDDFRDFNSFYGHAFGDRVIRFVASTITDITRDIGFAGRSGGDEFLICITDQPSIDGLDGVAQKLLDALSSELIVRETDKPLCVHCSIGIIIYPETRGDYSALIKKADEALYNVKRSGKNNFCLIR